MHSRNVHAYLLHIRHLLSLGECDIVVGWCSCCEGCSWVQHCGLVYHQALGH